jgi:hypothetical protein
MLGIHLALVGGLLLGASSVARRHAGWGLSSLDLQLHKFRRIVKLELNCFLQVWNSIILRICLPDLKPSCEHHAPQLKVLDIVLVSSTSCCSIHEFCSIELSRRRRWYSGCILELNFKLEKMEEWVQAGGRARERGCSDRHGMDPTPKVDGLFGFKRAAALWQLVINSY